MKSLDDYYPKFPPMRKSKAAKIGGYILYGLFYAAVAWIFFLAFTHFCHHG